MDLELQLTNLFLHSKIKTLFMKLKEFKAIISHCKELECKFGADGLQKVFYLLDINQETVNDAIPIRLKIREFNKKVEAYCFRQISELADIYMIKNQETIAKCLRSACTNHGDLNFHPYSELIIKLRNLEYDISSKHMVEDYDLSKDLAVKDILAKKQETENIYNAVIEELKRLPIFSPNSPECLFEIDCVEHFNRITGEHDILDYFVRCIKILNEDIDIKCCWNCDLLNQMKELEPDTFFIKLSSMVINEQKALQLLSNTILKTIECQK